MIKLFIVIIWILFVAIVLWRHKKQKDIFTWQELMERNMRIDRETIRRQRKQQNRLSRPNGMTIQPRVEIPKEDFLTEDDVVIK